MPDLTVSKYGGTITIGVDSTPSSNSTSYGTLPSYTSRNGNVITVPANTSYDRSFSLTVTATTNSDPSYQGTASSSSAWTVNQAGDLGPAPDEKYLTLNFNLTNSSSNARYPLVEFRGFGDDSGQEVQIMSGPAYKVDHIWPLTARNSMGESDSVNIVINLTDSQGGTYYYNYGMGTPTISGQVTVSGIQTNICQQFFNLEGVENTFYLELRNADSN